VPVLELAITSLIFYFLTQKWLKITKS
jgi:hypothetical protein